MYPARFSAIRLTLCELRDGSLEQLLLLLADLANGVNLLDTISAKRDGAGKELCSLILVQRALDVRALLDALLASERTEQAVGEYRSGVGHGERGASSSVLGLDEFVTAKLDSVDELVVLLSWLDGRGCRAGLREKRDNGDTRVSADDWDNRLGGLAACDSGKEGRGARHVESSHAVEPRAEEEIRCCPQVSSEGLQLTSWGRRRQPS